MARFARRAVVLALVLGLILVLLPAEKAPPSGGWISRLGIESHVVSIPRPGASGPLDIRYVRSGSGPTVILIHGLASSIYTWADVIAPLSRNFDVIALDLPGFGASSQPADLSFDDNPRAVLALMDALAVPRAHFVGNSMGGAVSLFLAARHGARVDRVVVLDSAGFNMRSADRPFLVRLMASPVVGVVTDLIPVKRVFTRATLGYLIHDPSRVTPERIGEYLAPNLRPGALASMRSLLASRVDERFEGDLGSIAAPTLVVWGRFDPWLPESHADRFVAAIKGARKVIMETGHMPQEEKPADVARLIGEFLIS